MRRTLLIALGMALALALLLATAAGAVPAPIDRWVVGSGAGRVEAGSIVLRGTLGESPVGIVAAGGKVLNSGYWWATIGSTIDVEPEPQAPAEFGFHAKGPNPFAAATAFALDLPQGVAVRAEVYGIRGNRVRVLAAAAFPAGRHLLAWDGRDDAGRRLPSGVYLLRVSAGELAAERKLVLIE